MKDGVNFYRDEDLTLSINHLDIFKEELPDKIYYKNDSVYIEMIEKKDILRNLYKSETFYKEDPDNEGEYILFDKKELF